MQDACRYPLGEFRRLADFGLVFDLAQQAESLLDNARAKRGIPT